MCPRASAGRPELHGSHNKVYILLAVEVKGIYNVFKIFTKAPFVLVIAQERLQFIHLKSQILTIELKNILRKWPDMGRGAASVSFIPCSELILSREGSHLQIPRKQTIEMHIRNLVS